MPFLYPWLQYESWAKEKHPRAQGAHKEQHVLGTKGTTFLRITTKQTRVGQ